jgi:Tol biopolymer transport system component
MSLACSKKSPTAPKPELSDDLGTALTAREDEQTGQHVWSADGREIFYVSAQAGSTYRLRAVNVTDKTKRTVDGIDRDYGLIGISPDGIYLYYAARPFSGGGRTLYRVPINGQNAELVLNNIGSVAISPHNDELAFTSSLGQADSLFLYNTARRAKTFYAFGDAVTFSPNVSQLAFLKIPSFQQPDSIYVVSLSLGSVQPFSISTGLSGAYDLTRFRWDANGFRVLVVSTGGSFILDIMARTTTPVSNGVLSAFHDWSPDGNKIATWALDNFASGQFGLYLIDVANANRTTRIGLGIVNDSAFGGEGQLVFSPNNRRIAIAFRGQLYVKDLP